MRIQLASDLHLDLLQRDWPGERFFDRNLIVELPI